jgi:M penetrans paralogue family 26
MDQFQTPKPLPNATAVLVLGILSIVFCFCYGFIGLVLGIIALVLASKDKKLYAAYPGEYSEGSFKNLKAGRICAIIGLILSALFIVYVIVIIGIIGFSALSDPQQLMERMNELK